MFIFISLGLMGFNYKKGKDDKGKGPESSSRLEYNHCLDDPNGNFEAFIINDDNYPAINPNVKYNSLRTYCYKPTVISDKIDELNIRIKPLKILNTSQVSVPASYESGNSDECLNSDLDIIKEEKLKIVYAKT